jgi:hypothetical protein
MNEQHPINVDAWWGLVYSLVVQHMLSVYEALGSISSTTPPKIQKLKNH